MSVIAISSITFGALGPERSWKVASRIDLSSAAERNE